MIADTLGRQTAKRMIQRLDPHHREFLVLINRRLGRDHVPARRGRGVVELEDKLRLDDRLVLLAHDSAQA
jgi:hypothetical protein